MTLATQMVDDTAMLANTDEHATAIDVMNQDGEIITDVPVIIEHKTKDDEKVTDGRDEVRRAVVGIQSSYEVTDDWQFKVDDIWWAVARDQSAPIADDSAGWLWVTVITAPVHDRGDPEFNAR